MRTILITGGAQGIGKCIVEQFIKEKNTVLIVIDKQETPFITKCQKNYADRFFFYLHDIADRNGLTPVLKKLKKNFQLDSIINNAGEVYLEKWTEFNMETWDRTLAVNVTAPLFIVQSLTDALKEGATIVNIASVDGLCAAFDTVAYAASKAALISVTKSLAANLGSRKIRANAIAPGWVETEMTKDTLPPEAQELTPLKRNAQPEEIAQVVGFLTSEQSSFITGQTVIVDGGLTSVDYTLYKESQR